MAHLQSDQHGFLVGDPVDLGRMPRYLLDIKSDVAAIKRAVVGGAANTPGRTTVNPSTDRSSAAINVPMRSRTSDHQRTVVERIRAVSNDSAVALPGRNAHGRFVSGHNDNAPSNRDTSGRFTRGGESDGAVTTLANRLSALSGIGSGLEEADPTVKAFQEIAEPMKRGLELFGGGDKKERWFRKIFGELKLFHRDETVFSRASSRSLHNIEGNPGGNGGGGDSSGIMLMLTGLLGRLGPMLLTGITAVLGFIFSPIGLAIGAASAVAWGLFTESGQKFFGEVGAKIIAGWDTVVTAFAPITESISKGWDTVKGGFDSLIGGMVSSWDTFTGFLKDKFGIDIPAIFKPVVDVSKKVVEGAKEAAKPVIDAVKSGHEAAVKYTTDNIIEPGAKAAERAYNVTASSAGSTLEKVMPGYRHKALFDGIKGGDSLTKNGSYTDEEAAKIRELKTSGANTSANVKGGMSLEIQDKISAQAKLNGLDPVMMQKMAAMESGGNANAVSSTGAAGIYQFTGQTASGVGIKNRFDADQNIEGGMKLTKQNSAVLEKSGLPVNAENLYMMHQLGPSAAKEVIMGAASSKSKADMSASTQKAMNLNYGSNSKTAEDYIATNKKALDDRYASVTKDTGGVQTALAKADDPTQAGRYKYEPLEGGKVQVTDSQDGTIGLASDEQANAYRKQQGKPYLDKVAAINSDYMSMYNRLAAGPVNTASTVSVPVPSAPIMPTSPKIADAPQVVQPLSSPEQRPLTVNVAAQDVGQDLSDRKIAHIVTGGLSG